MNQTYVLKCQEGGWGKTPETPWYGGVWDDFDQCSRDSLETLLELQQYGMLILEARIDTGEGNGFRQIPGVEFLIHGSNTSSTFLKSLGNDPKLATNILDNGDIRDKDHKIIIAQREDGYSVDATGPPLSLDDLWLQDVKALQGTTTYICQVFIKVEHEAWSAPMADFLTTVGGFI